LHFCHAEFISASQMLLSY